MVYRARKAGDTSGSFTELAAARDWRDADEWQAIRDAAGGSVRERVLGK